MERAFFQYTDCSSKICVTKKPRQGCKQQEVVGVAVNVLGNMLRTAQCCK